MKMISATRRDDQGAGNQSERVGARGNHTIYADVGNHEGQRCAPTTVARTVAENTEPVHRRHLDDEGEQVVRECVHKPAHTMSAKGKQPSQTRTLGRYARSLRVRAQLPGHAPIHHDPPREVRDRLESVVDVELRRHRDESCAGNRTGRPGRQHELEPRRLGARTPSASALRRRTHRRCTRR